MQGKDGMVVRTHIAQIFFVNHSLNFNLGMNNKEV